jgi:regulatory protein
VPGDASSSPSDRSAAGNPGGDAGEKLTVVTVELKGAAGEMVRIHLSDGSFYVLHAEVFVREGISAGTPLDPERIALLLSRSEHVLARVRALSLLSRAAHSRRGLARKLAARGFSTEAIKAAIARVSELGYLDDRVFAESWVRSRMSARKTGWNGLYKGLLQKGISRSLAEEIVGALCTHEEELERARQLSEGLSPRMAIRMLTSRGFRSRAIAKVVREKRETGREAAEE